MPRLDRSSRNSSDSSPHRISDCKSKKISSTSWNKKANRERINKNREEWFNRPFNYETDKKHKYTHDKNINHKNEGKSATNKSEKHVTKSPEKPCFEPSGLLATETNIKNGILLKYAEPVDSRIPNEKWRIYIYKKDDSESKIIYLHKLSCYLIGKEATVCEILLMHPTISKQHAAIQFRLRNSSVTPYLIDLDSTNGTYLNERRIEPSRFYEIKHGDSMKFGKSSRDFVIVKESEAKNVEIKYSDLLKHKMDTEFSSVNTKNIL